MIDFNRPAFTGREFDYIRDAVQRGMLCGDGEYTKRCSQWMMDKFHVNHVMLTTSCTHALEMAAHLCDIKPGDEVIMPSYTFVSTADAFVLKGAKIVFVDIRPDTMNIDEKLIEAAVTEKTKVIVPVHYAGVACEMDTIMEIAKKYNLKVVEDAAQGFSSYYKGKTCHRHQSLLCRCHTEIDIVFLHINRAHCQCGGRINDKYRTEFVCQCTDFTDWI